MSKFSFNLVIAASLLFGAGASAAPAGQVKIDGSSTVFPITEAVAEEFGAKFPKIRVTVGTSGTGGGFAKFAKGEIDINNASRTIKDNEAKTAKSHGVDFIAVPVAHDGVVIVVNKENTWAQKITTAELKKLWEPGSKVKTWKDLNPAYPAEKILLFGPGTDSGTFDYFTEAINGKSQLSRKDFTQSEDDNVLVNGVMGNKNALGYFGYAYYTSHKNKLRALPVDNGKGAIEPNEKTINDESYAPLSRVVYIYVSKTSAKRSEVKEFVNFYIDNVSRLVSEVGYVPLPDAKYKTAKKDFSLIK
jgi:phosphate transport system substrate-binding protein